MRSPYVGLIVAGLAGLAACEDVSFPALGGEEFEATLAGRTRFLP